VANLNVQNLPKHKDFLSSLVAAPGCVLLYTDFNSVEPHVMAHFTQDRGLMSVYGPDAKSNDIYLLTASGIDKWRDEVLRYYRPHNLTEENVEEAKKKLKAIRSAVKPIYLGWLYGLGAETMSVGTGISSEECSEILANMNSFFSGVTKFGQRLKTEWESTGGFATVKWVYDRSTNRNKPVLVDGAPGVILNGRMRPICVSPHKVKDLKNMFVQSTGHDVLMQFLLLINKARKEQNISMVPYNVDMHDATIWQVKQEHAEAGKKLIENCYKELNNILQWTVKIKGDVEIGTTLADFI